MSAEWSEPQWIFTAVEWEPWLWEALLTEGEGRGFSRVFFFFFVGYDVTNTNVYLYWPFPWQVTGCRLAGERGSGSRDETRSDVQEVAISLHRRHQRQAARCHQQVRGSGVTCRDRRRDSPPGRPRPLPSPPLTSGFVDIHRWCVSVQVRQVEVFERV